MYIYLNIPVSPNFSHTLPTIFLSPPFGRSDLNLNFISNLGLPQKCEKYERNCTLEWCIFLIDDSLVVTKFGDNLN